MLGNKKAVANVAVKDLAVATEFYENTLGLTPVHEEEQELVVFRSGTSDINVYRSEYAGTNKATAVTFAGPRQMPLWVGVNVTVTSLTAASARQPGRCGVR